MICSWHSIIPFTSGGAIRSRREGRHWRRHRQL
jgi:hypothetical protein